MPHVDELLGITTLASMGLMVAVSLQPVAIATTATATDRPIAAASATAIETPLAATAAVRAADESAARSKTIASRTKPGNAAAPDVPAKERT